MNFLRHSYSFSTLVIPEQLFGQNCSWPVLLFIYQTNLFYLQWLLQHHRDSSGALLSWQLTAVDVFKLSPLNISGWRQMLFKTICIDLYTTVQYILQHLLSTVALCCIRTFSFKPIEFLQPPDCSRTDWRICSLWQDRMLHYEQPPSAT